jgi:hypothetical protein
MSSIHSTFVLGDGLDVKIALFTIICTNFPYLLNLFIPKVMTVIYLDPQVATL